MAPFLPIRAANRSQGIRIGKKHIKTDVTTYIDLGDFASYPPVLKELQNHLSIGAVIVVGPLSNKPEPESGKLSTTTELEEEQSASESLGVVAVTIELKHTALIAAYGQFEVKSTKPEGRIKTALNINNEPTETQGGNEVGEAYRSFTLLPNGILNGSPLQPVTFRLKPGTYTFEVHVANETPESTITVNKGAYLELREL